jgi:hypothetical protein
MSADSNGDGMLTFDEWFTYSNGSEDKRENMALGWSQYDTEGKGYLTREEAYERVA